MLYKETKSAAEIKCLKPSRPNKKGKRILIEKSKSYFLEVPYNVA